MANDRDRKSAHGTVGPEGPPRPSEAEDTRAEPMAVANDKQTVHDKSHVPTTASLDQWDEDVARRYRQVPPENGGTTVGKGTTETREMNRAMEDPPGYVVEKETGWKKLEAFEDDEAEKETANEKD